MSNEMADSDVVAPETDSDAFPAEVNDGDENAADKEASQDTPSIQEKRLADTEKALQERQREFHEMSQKLAELKGQMSVMSQQNQPVAKDILDDEAIAAKLRDDPSAVLGIMKQKLAEQQSQFAGVLEARDRFYQEQISKSDPNVVLMRDKIAEMRKDPDMQAFSDQQLAILAKKSAKPGYRGAPGGQRQAQTNRSDDITESDLFKKIYPEWEPPKKK